MDRSWQNHATSVVSDCTVLRILKSVKDAEMVQSVSSGTQQDASSGSETSVTGSCDSSVGHDADSRVHESGWTLEPLIQ